MKYKVTLQKIYDTEFEVEAENEEEASEKANQEFNELVISGNELYSNYEVIVEEGDDD